MQADSYKQGLDQQGAVELGDISFATTGGFNLSALLVSLILVALYASWW
jgi:SSS family solute:Na+ symporter